jgi:hypothetical protein
MSWKRDTFAGSNLDCAPRLTAGHAPSSYPVSHGAGVSQKPTTEPAPVSMVLRNAWARTGPSSRSSFMLAVVPQSKSSSWLVPPRPSVWETTSVALGVPMHAAVTVYEPCPTAVPVFRNPLPARPPAPVRTIPPGRGPKSMSSSPRFLASSLARFGSAAGGGGGAGRSGRGRRRIRNVVCVFTPADDGARADCSQQQRGMPDPVSSPNS